VVVGIEMKTNSVTVLSSNRGTFLIAQFDESDAVDKVGTGLN